MLIADVDTGDHSRFCGMQSTGLHRIIPFHLFHFSCDLQNHDIYNLSQHVHSH